MKNDMKKRLVIAGILFIAVAGIILFQGFSNVTEGKKSSITLSASYTVASGQALVKVTASADKGIKSLKYKKGSIASKANIMQQYNNRQNSKDE